MIDQQPNNEEIFKILSEAKQYHREVLVKLIQANAPTESLEAMVDVLELLDDAGVSTSRLLLDNQQGETKKKPTLLDRMAKELELPPFPLDIEMIP